ncbi:MAG TPA: peptidoglycan DD-metalloendopeptidase family protein [Woeseiaceae bacterium]|nr:peptidoglycan DD-metalloendopeptidase family protein [Woeseiaceae bacterium]
MSIMPVRIASLLLVLMLAGCSSSPRYMQDAGLHVVKRGETLYEIADRYGRSVDELARLNRLGDGSLIYPGQVIRLPPPGGAPTAGAGRSAESLPAIPEQPSPGFEWPTDGRIDVEFGGRPGTGTGVLIDGRAGQPVRAAAAGTVVYAGSGLIGYGQLIIVKHNDTYLSAYGYNASLLVREGQTIRRGQQIATMGEGPERKSRLHFEIRRNGNPVNPRQFLPAR